MTFESLTQKLHTSMFEEYVSVTKKHNPIYCRRESMPQQHLARVLEQYVQFPKEIVTFLYNMQTAADQLCWTEISQEMARNIGEEEGSDSGGISHYDLLIDGIKSSLGVDFSRSEPIDATKYFTDAIYHHTRLFDHSGSYVAGATYALESSAVPELEIVVELTQQLALRKNGSANLSLGLQNFFDRHVQNWEVGHECRLRAACEQHVSDLNQFENGFRATLYTMDNWWRALSSYAKRGC